MRRKTLLFIPQTCRTFWQLSPDRYGPFIGPALSGFALLDGLPPQNRKVAYFGYSTYRLRTREQTDADRCPTALCARARRLGFRKVLVLREQEEGVSYDLISCDEVNSPN
jgi:hypothetical protein